MPTLNDIGLGLFAESPRNPPSTFQGPYPELLMANPQPGFDPRQWAPMVGGNLSAPLGDLGTLSLGAMHNFAPYSTPYFTFGLRKQF
jgi:hypothetical protein